MDEAEWSEDDRVELAALLDDRLGPAAVAEPQMVRRSGPSSWWQAVAGLVAIVTIPASTVAAVGTADWRTGLCVLFGGCALAATMALVGASLER